MTLVQQAVQEVTDDIRIGLNMIDGRLIALVGSETDSSV